jgi:S-adenosylmethionine hydrolase
MPIITLLTDFGTVDAYAGIMKGVILEIAPHAIIVDLTHSVPAQQILPGALLLRSAVPYFPEGTIHVAVVDPGVGSSRRSLVIETTRGLLIGPDNGVLSLAAAALGRRCVRAIENKTLMRPEISSTFHGRDVFAPVAARLACGVAPESVGPVLESIVEIDLPQPHHGATELRGEVIHVDTFGNLITNITAESFSTFPAHGLCVSLGEVLLTGLSAAYADVAAGEPVAVVGSWGTLEIAIRNGSAARALGAGVGSPVTVAWALRV